MYRVMSAFLPAITVYSCNCWPILSGILLLNACHVAVLRGLEVIVLVSQGDQGRQTHVLLEQGLLGAKLADADP